MYNNRGLTLIELIIVLAIIGILAAVAITAYIGQQRSATRAEAYTNLESLRLLEEQFFAETAAYTASLGVAGNTTAIRDANLLLIQGALPGFQPGGATNYSYRIIQNMELTPPVAVPYGGAGDAALAPCFVAIATGVAGTRVAGDVFAIDCNNDKNF